MSDIVTLQIGGVNFAGWLSVEVARSIEAAASSFSLSVSARYPGELNPTRIPPGAACELWIGTDKVITGYVDRVKPSIDAASHSITVAGRSKTCDLIDCAAAPDKASPKRWRGRTLDQLAAELAKPYGVEVVTIDPTGAAFSRIALERGETVFEAIDRYARQRQVLVCDDTAGRLVLTRTGHRRSSTGIAEGANMLTGESEADASQIFSTYVVKGQRIGDDEDFGDTVAQISGEASDPGCTRRRVTVINAENHTSRAFAKARAQWEAATRLGKSLSATITVQGWRERPGGLLWAPNVLVGVLSASLALDGDFLIAEVSYRLDDAGGEIAELKLAPPAAYLSEPIKVKSRGGGGLWKEIRTGAKLPPKAAP